MQTAALADACLAWKGFTSLRLHFSKEEAEDIVSEDL